MAFAKDLPLDRTKETACFKYCSIYIYIYQVIEKPGTYDFQDLI